MRRLAWVTARRARGTDVDEPLAVLALRAAGAEVEVVDWNDPAVDWSSYDRVVVRSAWDYTDRLAEFLRWVDAVATTTDLRNPAPMLRWSTDKHYLAELGAAGVPVIPTQFAEPGDSPRLPPGGVVVKPAVGAGSREVGRYDGGQHERAAAHAARLHAAGLSVLVQPLLASVAVEGEWPLVFFAGRFSHAARKRVALPAGRPIDGLHARETPTPHSADQEQGAVAAAALDVVTERFGTPTYARVDLVRDNDGRVCVLELELVEPSLFLPQAGAAAVQRLVAALTTP